MGKWNRSFFHDRELKDQVEKAEQEGLDISVIVLYKTSVKLDQVEQTTVEILRRVSQATGQKHTKCTLRNNMECFEIECSPAYVKHLALQPEVKQVVQNTIPASVMDVLRAKQL